jgi:hypothetical protein
MNQEQYYDELISIEREKLKKRQPLLERHFGAIIGACLSFGALVGGTDLGCAYRKQISASP